MKKHEVEKVVTEEKVTTSELTLNDVLSNIDEINSAGEDKEITITHTRLHADFKFLVPQLADLSKVGGKDIEMNVEEVYKVLSLNLLTRITDEMLKALKVASQVDALKKLFTEDEIVIVMAELMDGVQDNGIVVKKR